MCDPNSKPRLWPAGNIDADDVASTGPDVDLDLQEGAEAALDQDDGDPYGLLVGHIPHRSRGWLMG